MSSAASPHASGSVSSRLASSTASQRASSAIDSRTRRSASCVEPVDRVGAVDRLEHGAQPRRHVGSRRHRERDAGVADPPLRPHQPLRHRRRARPRTRERSARRRSRARSAASAACGCRDRSPGARTRTAARAACRGSRRGRATRAAASRSSASQRRSPAAARSSARRRSAARSRSRLRATVTSHPSGLSGMPDIRPGAQRLLERVGEGVLGERDVARRRGDEREEPAVRRPRGAFGGRADVGGVGHR